MHYYTSTAGLQEAVVASPVLAADEVLGLPKPGWYEIGEHIPYTGHNYEGIIIFHDMAQIYI